MNTFTKSYIVYLLGMNFNLSEDKIRIHTDYRGTIYLVVDTKDWSSQEIHRNLTYQTPLGIRWVIVTDYNNEGINNES